MFLGLVLAIIVAILWSLGEISYSNLSKNLDRANVYLYQYLIRAIIYLSVVFVCDIGLFTSFSFDRLLSFLPIILCDLFGSYVINIAMANGKLSVVSPIMSSYPILSIFLAMMVLKEKVTGLELVLAFVIAISIIVLASNQKKSKKAPHPLKGIIFSVVYMVLMALSAFLEKSIYNASFVIFEFYFYKGIVYSLTSIIFMIIIGISPVKLKKFNMDILKGTFITPVGNVLYSFALCFGNMILVAPISSMYSVITNFISRRVLKEKLTYRESICIALILSCTIMLIVIGLI